MSVDESSDTSVTFGQFGRSFQEKVLQAMLLDKQWAQQMLDVFDVKYFELKYLHYLSEKYFSYAKKYKDFPTIQLLVTIVKDDLKIGVADLHLRDQIVDYLQRVKANPNPEDLPFVKDKSLEFCRKQALKQALEKAVDLVEVEKYEAVVELVKEAVTVGTTPSLGHDFFDDAEARFVNIERNCIPTGIPQLDAKEILQGGVGKGELSIVMGATGTGKCSLGSTNIHIRYVGIKINGKLYKPWDKLVTKRGKIFARDIIESDEIV